MDIYNSKRFRKVLTIDGLIREDILASDRLVRLVDYFVQLIIIVVQYIHPNYLWVEPIENLQISLKQIQIMLVNFRKNSLLFACIAVAVCELHQIPL